MTNDEKQLLENVLDGLDRLFDRESRAIDLRALIYATSIALQGTEYFAVLHRAVEDLENIVRSPMQAEDERNQALVATDDLRIFVAQTLRFHFPDDLPTFTHLS